MKSGAQIYVKGSVEAVELYKKAFHLTPDSNMTFFSILDKFGVHWWVSI